MKKRFISLITACALSGSLFAGFPAAAEESNLDTETPITLTLYGPGDMFASEEDSLDIITGATKPGYHVIVERWNELHPNVTLNIEGIGWTDWRAAIAAAVSGGNVDIVLHGGLLPELVDDLTPYLEKDPEFIDAVYNISGYHTADMEGNTLETASITAIPATLNAGGFVLDKQIFDDYGVALPDETYTWEDVLTLAEQLTGTDPVTGEETYGYLIRGTNGTSLIKSYSVIASAYDAKAIEYAADEKDSTVDFTGEKTIEVFDLLQKLAQYCSPDNVEGVAGELVLDENNQTAMGWTETVASAIKNIQQQGLEDRFVFLTLPQVTEGENAGSPSPYLGDNNIAICKYSENKEWAWEFIKFLLTDETCAKFMADNGLVGNCAKAIELLGDTIGTENAEMIQKMVAGLPEGFNSTTNDYYDGINFGTMASYLSGHLAELVKGNVTPEECAANIQNEVNQIFATLE